MKRILSMMLAMLIFTTMFVLPASAEGKKSGLFTYELKGNGTAAITDFDWAANGNDDVYIPGMIDGYTVTTIAEKAFYNSYTGNTTNNVAVVLPNTITQIGEYAFYYCENVASINIPASVQIIDAGAFAFTAPEIKFTVDAGSSTFATIEGVLYNKVHKELICCPRSIGKLSVPEGILSISDFAFAGCAAHIALPNTLTEIGNYAFTYCNAPNMKLPISLTTIGEYAFLNAIWYIEDGYLRYIHIPSNVSLIGEGAFSKCQAGDNVVMDYYTAIVFDNNNTLTELPIRCFEEVDLPSNMGYCIWPTSLTKVGDYAFYGSDIGDSNDFILPSTLKEIGAYAFSDTQLIETFVIPNGVETLGEGCFLNKKEYLYSDLKELVIPATVTSIGDNICDRTKVSLCVDAGSYAALWASENGYPTTNAGGDDTSWLNG